MYITYLDESFDDKNSFAVFLGLNFKRLIKDIESHKLESAIAHADPDLYKEYASLTKDYKYAQNKMTLLLYLLDKKAGMRVNDDVFYKVKDIYYLMRLDYPKKIDQIVKLFYDPILRDIYKIKFESSYEDYYKKYYDFFLDMYEYRDYDFTYYYFFYWHLDRGENVRFIFDNVRMQSMKELIAYLKANENKMSYLLTQIKKNPYILALIARYKTIKDVALAYDNEDEYALLNVLTLEQNNEFDAIVMKKMSYFLIDNYTRYQYKTREAKALKTEYQNLKLLQTTKALTVTEAAVKATELYTKFVNLYEFNDVIAFRKGIVAKDESSKLAYLEGGEYVSELYLKTYSKYNPNIHSEIYARNCQKEILVNMLSECATKNNTIKDEYLKLEIKPKKTKLVMNFIMIFLAICLSGFLGYLHFDEIVTFFKLEYDFSHIYSFSGAINFMGVVGPLVLCLYGLIMFLVNLRKLSNITKFRKFEKTADKTNLLYVETINDINTDNITNETVSKFMNREKYYLKNQKTLNKFGKEKSFELNGFSFALLNLVVFLLLTFVGTKFINNYIPLFMFLDNIYYYVGYGLAFVVFLLTAIINRKKFMLLMPYLLVGIYVLVSYLIR